MNRYTAADKEYITYQEAKDKGWNEYACREEELKRRLKSYEDTGLNPEEIMAVMGLAEKMNICDLVRENLKLSNTIRHLEADLKIER